MNPSMRLAPFVFDALSCAAAAAADAAMSTPIPIASNTRRMRRLSFPSDFFVDLGALRERQMLVHRRARQGRIVQADGVVDAPMHFRRFAQIRRAIDVLPPRFVENAG